MIILAHGDLLKSNCDVIGHQCNCQLKMDSGIAKQIRQQFPQAYQNFKDDDRTPREKLGSYSFALCTADISRFVFNLYGQLHFGRFDCVYTDYNALRLSLMRMVTAAMEIQSSAGFDIKIGLPYGIGCGLAGGDWKIVEGIIEEVSTNFDKDIYQYKL